MEVVPVHPIDERVTGFVGLVVQPDAETIRTAYALAAATVRDDAEMRLGPGQLPHVTLTQCVLRDAPRARIGDFTARLTRQLAGARIPLTTITTFPGGFLFWCVDAGSAERKLLQTAHEDALPLADGFLDPVGNAAVVEGTRRLTNDDPQLVANARTFGYAFVRDRYLPHVTLGFDPRLAAGAPPADGTARPHVMIVERVVLARFGRHGRVEEICV